MKLNTVLVNDKSISPSKIVCIGRNYVDHIQELNNEIPQEMVVFIKPNSAIADQLQSTHEEPLHYESEICFVVKNQCLAAVAFGLDLTKRSLQSRLKAKGLPWERAKCFDGAALFSPFVDIDEIKESLTVQLEINGVRVQNGSVELMINKPAQILEELMSFLTLNDGDIVMTGTPEGVGVINAGDRFTGKIINNGKIMTQRSWDAI
jgi:2-keto-4-pentenoate hydratase/2-oxohepta-3-ene-1,7-dioic acid hydratase in catechol pathway